MIYTDVRYTPIHVEEALTPLRVHSSGGLNLFLGMVRDHDSGRPVTRLEYHAYETMAHKQMARIAAGIQAELQMVHLVAVHRLGVLEVGEIAVLCAASSPHRAEAFRAARLLIDRIKHEVPIWKREHGPDGPYWVGFRDARCQHSAHDD